MATFLLEQIARALWGFKPNLMRHIVAQRGAGAALVWFVRNMPRYESTLKKWGPLRTHAVCTAISLVNGCSYCVRGHALALQLHVLRASGALFALDDDQILALAPSGADAVVAALQTSLDVAYTTSLTRWLALKNGAAPADTDEDHRLAHLNAMFGVLNACGIRGAVVADEAHDPINKDRGLVERYAALRSASRPAAI